MDPGKKARVNLWNNRAKSSSCRNKVQKSIQVPQMEPHLSFYKFTTPREQQRAAEEDLAEIAQANEEWKNLCGKSLVNETSIAGQPQQATKVDSAEIARANKKSNKMRGKSLFIDKTPTAPKQQEANPNPNQNYIMASKCLDHVEPKTNLKILQPSNKIAAPVGTEIAKNVNLIERDFENVVLEPSKKTNLFSVDKFTDKSNENAQVLQALKVPNKKKLQETKVKPGTESCPICGVNVKKATMESHVYRAHLKIRRRASIF